MDSTGGDRKASEDGAHGKESDGMRDLIIVAAALGIGVWLFRPRRRRTYRVAFYK